MNTDVWHGLFMWSNALNNVGQRNLFEKCDGIISGTMLSLNILKPFDLIINELVKEKI